MKKYLYFIVPFLVLFGFYINCSSSGESARSEQDGSRNEQWPPIFDRPLTHGTWYVSGDSLSHPAMNTHQAFTIVYFLNPNGTFIYKFYFSSTHDGLTQNERTTLMPEDYVEYEMTGTWDVTTEGVLQLRYTFMSILLGNSVSLTECADNETGVDGIHATSLSGEIFVHQWEYPTDPNLPIRPYSFSLQNPRLGLCPDGETDGSDISPVTHNLYANGSFVRLGGRAD